MKLRVLLVDDEPIIRKAIARELRASFDILEAGSYAEALRKLKRKTGGEGSR